MHLTIINHKFNAGDRVTFQAFGLLTAGRVGDVTVILRSNGHRQVFYMVEFDNGYGRQFRYEESQLELA